MLASGILGVRRAVQTPAHFSERLIIAHVAGEDHNGHTGETRMVLREPYHRYAGKNLPKQSYGIELKAAAQNIVRGYAALGDDPAECWGKRWRCASRAVDFSAAGPAQERLDSSHPAGWRESVGASGLRVGSRQKASLTPVPVAIYFDHGARLSLLILNNQPILAGKTRGNICNGCL